LSESDSDEDDEDDEDQDSTDSDYGSPTNNLIRESRDQAAKCAKEDRKAKKRAEKAKQNQMAKQRYKKDINLNNLTSLSGPKIEARSPLKCFKCGGPHFKAECSEQKRGYPGGDEGPPRKSLRSR
jgi:hypothetical protein